MVAARVILPILLAFIFKSSRMVIWAKRSSAVMPLPLTQGRWYFFTCPEGNRLYISNLSTNKHVPIIIYGSSLGPSAEVMKVPLRHDQYIFLNPNNEQHTLFLPRRPEDPEAQLTKEYTSHICHEDYLTRFGFCVATNGCNLELIPQNTQGWYDDEFQYV